MSVQKKFNPNLILSIALLAGVAFSVITIALATAPDPGHNFTEVSGGVVQGNILYGSATDVLSALPKDANATRYLSNTGASNNPAWAQVDLANGVTGLLPNGNLSNSSLTINGTAISLGASGTVTAAAGTLTGTVLNSTVVTSSLTSVGTLANLTVTNPIVGSITGNAATATTATSATTATNIAGGLGGQIPYQSAAGTTALLANGTAGQVLTSAGTTLAPTWTTPSTGDMTLAGVQTITGAKTFGTIGGAVGKLILAGSSSGSTILDASTVAGSGTVVLPITGTLATLAGAEALTNKDLTGAGNTFPTFTAAAGTLTGTTLNSTVTASSLTSVGTIASLRATQLGAGGAPVPSTALTVGSVPSAIDSRSIYVNTIIPTTSTTSHRGLEFAMTTAAAAWTLPTLYTIYVSDIAIGASSAVTTQNGITIDALTHAANNYGLKVGKASTNTVWLSTNTDDTTAAGGIVFGLSKDTTLYRSAASTLKTDGSLSGLFRPPAGTATAGTAPLKFTSGTSLGTTEAGAVEFDGTHLYFTAANAGTRYQLDQQSGSLPLTGSGATVVADTPLLDMTETWNNAAVTFNAIKLNITSTASAALSKLIDLQVATVSKFNVDKAGLATVASGVSFPGGSKISNPSVTDGYLYITNAAGNDFTRLYLGPSNTSGTLLYQSSGTLTLYAGDLSRRADLSTGSLNISSPVNQAAMTVAGSTNSGGNPLIDIAGTWNVAGGAPTGIKLNITNTASLASSLLMDLQTSTVSKFAVRVNGNVGIGNAAPTSKLDLLPTATFAAAGVSGVTTEAHTVTLSGANPTTYATFFADQIGAMTLAGTNINQTVTDAAGLSVVPPIKSTNVALTNTYGILIPVQAVSTATNAYGITVNTPTGASNNYAAALLGGNVGIGTTTPTALLNIKAGTAAAGTAPLKFTSGTNLTTTEAGAIEFDGTHLYFTAANAGTRYQLDQQAGGFPIVGTGATVVADTPLLDMTETWNNAAVTFNAIKLNITSTASAALSKLIDLQVATVSKFNVDKAGLATVASGVSISGGTRLSSASDGYLSLTNAAGTGFSRLYLGPSTTSGVLFFQSGGTITMYAGDISHNADLSVGTLTSSPQVNQTGLIVTGAAINSGANALVDIAGTWNTAGGAPTGIKLNVTNTASLAASLLMDLEVGSVSKFAVRVDGNVGIGTAAPGSKLDIQGAGNQLQTITATTGTNAAYSAFVNTGGAFYVGRDSGAGGQIVTGGLAYAGSIVMNDAHAIQFGTNNAMNMTILSGGNVGIGTSAPGSKLDIRLVNVAVASGPVAGNLMVSTTDAQAINKGGSIGLGGSYNDAGTQWTWGVIHGGKENGTTGDSAGYLRFLTNATGGTLAEHMRIDSIGVVTFNNNVNQATDVAANLGSAAVRWANVHALNFYGAYNAGPDVAERYPASEPVEAGDVVMLDPNPPSNKTVSDQSNSQAIFARGGEKAKTGKDIQVTIKKADETGILLGIISTAPGVTMSDPSDHANPPVTLVGRVPAKVSEENGQIHTGDRLTVSKTIPGFAMKQTESGQSIGIALENSSPSDNKILVFVNLNYQIISNDLLNSSGGVLTTNQDILDILGKYATSFFSGVLTKVENGVAYLKGVVTESLTVGSPTKATGVTVYDKNGQVGCLEVNNVNTGAVNVRAGACENQTLLAASPTPPTPPSPAPTPFVPTPAPTPTNPEPAPASTPSPIDTIAPVITLVGPATINLNVGDTYGEFGVNVTDNVDTSVPVVIGGTVDTATPGTYVITYNATDAAGNHALEVTRTVNVVAPTPAPALPETGFVALKTINPLYIIIALLSLMLIFVSAALVWFVKKFGTNPAVKESVDSLAAKSGRSQAPETLPEQSLSDEENEAQE